MKHALLAITALAALAGPARADFFMEGLQPFAERHCHPAPQTADHDASHASAMDAVETDFDGPVCPPEKLHSHPSFAVPGPVPGPVPQK